MYICEDTLDDLLAAAFQLLFEKGSPERARRGSFLEVVGVTLELKNPRARLSRSETKGRPFSCLGELLWYLSGSNAVEQIEWYIREYKNDAESDGTLHGAYGPRLFNAQGENQIQNVTDLLKKRKTTRQAVIQLFSPLDLSKSYKEIPCTTTIQYICRDDKLHCIVTMRSNDCYMGFPHDVYCFTMLQEIIAREIGIEVGVYKHFVGSLHLYEENIENAKTFLTEGFQSPIPMPEMPAGSQWPHIESVLAFEKLIRTTDDEVEIGAELPEYWQDIIRLLDVYRSSANEERIIAIGKSMHSDVYKYYLERRKTVSRPKSDRRIRDAS